MDLATDYLGLRLRNPLVASASPLSQTVDGIRRLADAGIGAVVLYSQFEEQLAGPPTVGTGWVDPAQQAENLRPADYLTVLEQTRRTWPSTSSREPTS